MLITFFCFVLTALLIPSLYWNGMGMDEGALLAYPDLLSRGYFPYKDYEYFYGPANIYRLYFIYEIFGYAVEVERYVGLFDRVLCLIGIGLWCNTYCKKFRWIPLLLTTVALSLTGTTALNWFAGFGLLNLGIGVFVLNERLTPPRVFLSGICFGLAIAFRLDFIAVVAIFLLCQMFYRGSQRKELLVGVVACLLPLFLILPFASLKDFIESTFITPFIRVGSRRSLALIGLDVWTLGLVAVLFAGPLLSLRRAALQPFAVSSLVLVFYVASRFDLAHVTAVLPFAVALLGISICNILNQPAQKPKLLLAMVGMLLVLAHTPLPDLTNYVRKDRNKMLWVMYGDRQFPVADRVQQASLQAAIDHLHTHGPHTGSLFVGHKNLRKAVYNDTFIYWLLPQYAPGSYFLELNPGSANRENSPLWIELPRVDVLILCSHWEGFQGEREDGLGPNIPNEIVKEHFSVVHEYGSCAVYLNKSHSNVPPVPAIEELAHAPELIRG